MKAPWNGDTDIMIAEKDPGQWIGWIAYSGVSGRRHYDRCYGASYDTVKAKLERLERRGPRDSDVVVRFPDFRGPER